MQIQKYKFKYVQTMSYEAHLVLSRQTTSRNDDDDDYDDYNHGDSGGADDDTSVQQDALGLASQEECTEGAKEYKYTSPAAEPHLGLPGKPTTSPLSKQIQIQNTNIKTNMNANTNINVNAVTSVIPNIDMNKNTKL